MSKLRKKFEGKLSERVKIILIDCDFNNFENRYCYCDFEKKDDFNLGVINGAWYMFFEDHEKQQAIIDDLRQQLNNMEACYIEKKKRVEVCAALAVGWNEITWDKTTHWTEGYEEGCYHCSAQIEEALRGES